MRAMTLLLVMPHSVLQIGYSRRTATELKQVATMTKRFLQNLLFAISLSSTAHTLAASSDQLPTTVRQALAKAEIPLSAVGILAKSVDTAGASVEWNQTQVYNPASTMKLVTTAAALDLLGPSFTWKTQAYSNGIMLGDVLQGDLVLKGGGDPKLVTENLWLFLRQLRAQGLREIRGNLLLDRSAFKLDEVAPDQFDNDPQRAYNANPDPLMLNFQALRIRLHAQSANGTVLATLDPPMADFSVTAPRLVNLDCGNWKDKLGLNLSDNTLEIGGTFASNCGDQILNVYPYQLQPNRFFGAAFTAIWRELGGAFDGKVVDGVVPSKSQLLSEWESPPLIDVIRDINKFSNNVMARQLLYTLGMSNDSASGPATRQRGAQRIKEWLDTRKINTAELVMENGSGLSRAERISPQTMVEILVAAYHSPYMPEFLASLPIVGSDGTMRHRLTDKSVTGQAHIKTGTLKDAKAIAGYLLAASGKTYVIVFDINHANAARGQAAQDALLEWLYLHG